ncbi:MAG: hypothetical protein HC884_12075 [Chloroflexaceae bacterium]|nr:hypothetical protein [Chloroflexaceae bacterium]
MKAGLIKPLIASLGMSILTVLALFVFGSVRTQAAQPGQPRSGTTTARQAIALAEMPTSEMSFTLSVDQTDVMVGDEVLFTLMQDVVSPTEEMTVTFYFGDGEMDESMFVSGTQTISVSHWYEYPSADAPGGVYTPRATVVVSGMPYDIVPDMGMDEITVRPRLTMTAVPTQVVAGGTVIFLGKIWPQITNIVSPNNEYVHITSVDEMGTETFSATLPISQGLGWQNVEDYTTIMFPVPHLLFGDFGWWIPGKTYTITAHYMSGLYGMMAAEDYEVIHVLPAPTEVEIESFTVNGTEAPADVTVMQGDNTEFQVMTTTPVTMAMAKYYVMGMDEDPMMTEPFTGTVAPTVVYTYPEVTEAISYMVYAEIVDASMMELATSDEMTLTVEVPYLNAVSVSADPASIQIGGAESAIVATLSDQNGDPWMMEEEVTFTTTAGSFSADEAMTEKTVTSSNGQAAVTLYSGDETATAVVTASAGGFSDNASVEFTRPGETASKKYVVGNTQDVTLTNELFAVVIPPNAFTSDPNLMVELMAEGEDGLPDEDLDDYLGLGYTHFVCTILDEVVPCPEPASGLTVEFTYTNPATAVQATPVTGRQIQLDTLNIAMYDAEQQTWELLDRASENGFEQNGDTAKVRTVTTEVGENFAGVGTEAVEGNIIYLPLIQK